MTVIHIRKITDKALRSYGMGAKSLENSVQQVIGTFCQEIAALNGQAMDSEQMILGLYGDVIATMMFGEKFTNEQRTLLRRFLFLACRSAHPTEHALFDQFPWLRYFGNKSYTLLEECATSRDLVMEPLFKKMKETFDPTHIRGIFDGLLLATSKVERENGRSVKSESGKLTDMDIKAMITNMTVAGSSTSAYTANAALLLLLNYPQIATSIQQELDEVVPDGSLPSIDDLHHLRYMEAFILEVLRFITTLPLIPRIAESDTEVNGYIVPAGTQVFLNTWSVNHGETFYDNPSEFRPERFLTDDGDVVPPTHPTRKNLTTLGIGRRVCIAENIGQMRLFQILASILKMFDLLPETDGNVPTCDPHTFEVGIVLLPRMFKIRMVPRN